mmetsp:Transcript_23241/g.25888  ORF Transcript_23241/g.25888 Transcript_23241/m.25888 type:complete len:585 (-) Transcript_23241:98-1852(-)
MIFLTKKNFPVLLASYTVASISHTTAQQVLGQNQNEESHGVLRGGRFGNGSRKSYIPSNMISPVDDRIIRTKEKTKRLLKLGHGSTNDETIRVMIDCHDKEDYLSCKERILYSIPESGVIRLTHYLDLTNAWAAEVKDMSTLNKLDDDVQLDRPRETLHIKESIQVHRKLQSTSQSTPYGIQLVKAKEVWDQYNIKGENVRVCVMDTGVNRDHPDLDQLFGYDGNELVQPWWRDVDGHGTHVAGTIVANDNNLGVVGVAPGAEVFVARVFSTNGFFYSSNIITALQVCKDGGAQIISMSLGGPESVPYEQQAYKDLYEKFNIVTVAASGNTGGYDFLYPAAYDHVISVASVNRYGSRSTFSTRNSKVNVAAPGESILSTWENGSYATVSGTSMACPHVSGVVALMLSSNPSATPAQIFSVLASSSENPNTTGSDSNIGHGLVNALAAVEAISSYSNNNGTPNDGNNNIEDDIDDSSESDDSGSTDIDSSCVELVITLRTDRYASDTSHWLQSGNEYLFYQNDFDSFETYRQTACVDPLVCTTYNIRDSFGDGINGEGTEIKYGGIVEYSGGDFGVGGIKEIGSC